MGIGLNKKGRYKRMKKTAKQIIEDYGTKQLQSKITVCPRCGNPALKANPIDNCLSRYVDAYICNDCGTDESMRDYFKSGALPFEFWHAVIEEKGME